MKYKGYQKKGKAQDQAKPTTLQKQQPLKLMPSSLKINLL
jgi:hypothetical protein